MTRWVMGAVSVMLAGSVTLGSAPARADGLDGLGPALVALMDVPLMVLTVVPTVGNTVYAAGGHRAPAGWRVAGYVTGGLATAAGAWSLQIAGQTGGDDGRFMVAVGLPTLALGVLDVAASIWTGSQAEQPVATRGSTTHLAFVPSVVRDAGGHTVSAVGLRLTGF